MAQPQQLLEGEFHSTLDDRWRLSIPKPLVEQLAVRGKETKFTLAKERPGCLSLWFEETWGPRVRAGRDLVLAKLQAGKLQDQIGRVQLLGRLLSTRHKEVQLASNGRLLIPEGFREFLRVEVGGEVMVIGAAVCIEIWQPSAWIEYLDRRVTRFRKLLDTLSG
jgi:MraZ protein